MNTTTDILFGHSIFKASVSRSLMHRMLLVSPPYTLASPLSLLCLGLQSFINVIDHIICALCAIYSGCQWEPHRSNKLFLCFSKWLSILKELQPRINSNTKVTKMKRFFCKRADDWAERAEGANVAMRPLAIARCNLFYLRGLRNAIRKTCSCSILSCNSFIKPEQIKGPSCAAES